MKITIYDTTLRDGAQTEGVSYTVSDKLKISEKLDDLGVHYIEGGWPGSNPKDRDFFAAVKRHKFRHAKVAAFGATRRKSVKAHQDANLRELVRSGASVITIFGKSWDLHVTDILKTTLDENIRMIGDSVRFLKKKKRTVFYDAEHFFDGFKQNPDYALKTILAAQEAGADAVILCDTNGGSLPGEVHRAVSEVKTRVRVPLGIHTHNDLEMGVANALAAVDAGCSQVQGTFCGLGERCGNANLGTLIGILHTKLRYETIPRDNIKKLMSTCYFISEISNYKIQDNQAFVGHSAFAHKGGVHIDAMLKNPRAYEHMDPAVVGNHRRFITSELAGKMPIIMKAKAMKLELDKKSPRSRRILRLLQDKENLGYQFEAADASFELFMKRELNKYKEFFKLDRFKVVVEKRYDGKVFAETSMRLVVQGKDEFSATEGDGPVDALNKALCATLIKYYPNISTVRLSDFKVRVLDTKAGTAAKVRVLIESQDDTDAWTTVGVHENIIEASWEALVDSIEYKLLKDKEKKP